MSEDIKQFDFKLFISITVVCTAVMLLFGYANPLLGWNADDFHLWQVVTAHFIHYDLKHLLSNIAALAILLYLFPVSFKSHVLGIVIAIVLIDVYLWFSKVQYYIGYSGLLYVILGLAFSKDIFCKRHINALLIIIIYGLYVVLTFDTVNNSNGIIWLPLHQAHFLGFISGMFVMLVSELSQEYTKFMSINENK